MPKHKRRKSLTKEQLAVVASLKDFINGSGMDLKGKFPGIKEVSGADFIQMYSEALANVMETSRSQNRTNIANSVSLAMKDTIQYIESKMSPVIYKTLDSTLTNLAAAEAKLFIAGDATEIKKEILLTLIANKIDDTSPDKLAAMAREISIEKFVTPLISKLRAEDPLTAGNNVSESVLLAEIQAKLGAITNDQTILFSAEVQKEVAQAAHAIYSARHVDVTVDAVLFNSIKTAGMPEAQEKTALERQFINSSGDLKQSVKIANDDVKHINNQFKKVKSPSSDAIKQQISNLNQFAKKTEGLLEKNEGLKKDFVNSYRRASLSKQRETFIKDIVQVSYDSTHTSIHSILTTLSMQIRELNTRLEATIKKEQADTAKAAAVSEEKNTRSAADLLKAAHKPTKRPPSVNTSRRNSRTDSASSVTELIRMAGKPKADSTERKPTTPTNVNVKARVSDYEEKLDKIKQDLNRYLVDYGINRTAKMFSASLTELSAKVNNTNNSSSATAADRQKRTQAYSAHDASCDTFAMRLVAFGQITDAKNKLTSDQTKTFENMISAIKQSIVTGQAAVAAAEVKATDDAKAEAKAAEDAKAAAVQVAQLKQELTTVQGRITNAPIAVTEEAVRAATQEHTTLKAQADEIILRINQSPDAVKGQLKTEVGNIVSALAGFQNQITAAEAAVKQKADEEAKAAADARLVAAQVTQLKQDVTTLIGRITNGTNTPITATEEGVQLATQAYATLKAQANEIINRINQSPEAVRTQVGSEVDNINSALAGFQNKISATDATVKQTAAEEARAAADAKVKAAEAKAAEEARIKEAEAQAAAIATKVEQFKQELTGLQGRIPKSLEDPNTVTKAEILYYSNTFKSLSEEAEEIIGRIQASSDEVKSQLTSTVDATNSVLAEFKNKIDAVVASVKAEDERLAAEAKAAAAAKAAITAEVTQLQQQLTALQERIPKDAVTTTDAAIQYANETHAALTRDADVIFKKIQASSDAVKGQLTSSVDATQSALTEFQSRIDTAVAAVKQEADRIAAEARAAEAEKAAAAALAKEKFDTQVAAIRAELMDLQGRIPERVEETQKDVDEAKATYTLLSQQADDIINNIPPELKEELQMDETNTNDQLAQFQSAIKDAALAVVSAAATARAKAEAEAAAAAAAAAAKTHQDIAAQITLLRADIKTEHGHLEETKDINNFDGLERGLKITSEASSVIKSLQDRLETLTTNAPPTLSTEVANATTELNAFIDDNNILIAKFNDLAAAQGAQIENLRDQLQQIQDSCNNYSLDGTSPDDINNDSQILEAENAITIALDVAAQHRANFETLLANPLVIQLLNDLHTSTELALDQFDEAIADASTKLNAAKAAKANSEADKAAIEEATKEFDAIIEKIDQFKLTAAADVNINHPTDADAIIRAAHINHKEAGQLHDDQAILAARLTNPELEKLMGPKIKATKEKLAEFKTKITKEKIALQTREDAKLTASIQVTDFNTAVTVLQQSVTALQTAITSAESETDPAKKTAAIKQGLLDQITALTAKQAELVTTLNTIKSTPAILADPANKVDASEASLQTILTDLTSAKDKVNKLVVTPTPTPAPTTTTNTTTTTPAAAAEEDLSTILRKLPDVDPARVNTLKGASSSEFSKAYDHSISDNELLKRSASLLQHLELKLKQAGMPNAENIQTRKDLIKDWNEILYPLLARIENRRNAIADLTGILKEQEDLISNNKTAFFDKPTITIKMNKLNSIDAEYGQIYEKLYNKNSGIRATIQKQIDEYKLNTIRVESHEVSIINRKPGQSDADFQAVIRAGMKTTFEKDSSTALTASTNQYKFNLATQVAIMRLDGTPSETHTNATKTMYTISQDPTTAQCEVAVRHLRADLDIKTKLVAAALASGLVSHLKAGPGTDEDRVKAFFSTYNDKAHTQDDLKSFMEMKAKAGECNLSTSRWSMSKDSCQSFSSKISDAYTASMRDSVNPNAAGEPSLLIALEVVRKMVASTGHSERVILTGKNPELVRAAILVCRVMEQSVTDPNKNWVYKCDAPNYGVRETFDQATIDRTKAQLIKLDPKFLEKVRLESIKKEKIEETRYIENTTIKMAAADKKAGMKDTIVEVDENTNPNVGGPRGPGNRSSTN